MGQRCEFEDLEGPYLPSRERVFKTASVGGAGALLVVAMAVFVFMSALVKRWVGFLLLLFTPYSLPEGGRGGLVVAERCSFSKKNENYYANCFFYS